MGPKGTPKHRVKKKLQHEHTSLQRALCNSAYVLEPQRVQRKKQAEMHQAILVLRRQVQLIERQSHSCFFLYFAILYGTRGTSIRVRCGTAIQSAPKRRRTSSNRCSSSESNQHTQNSRRLSQALRRRWAHSPQAPSMSAGVSLLISGSGPQHDVSL